MDYCVPPFFSPFYMVGLSILKSLYPHDLYARFLHFHIECPSFWKFTQLTPGIL